MKLERERKEISFVYFATTKVERRIEPTGKEEGKKR
jgi:hypothetical protein